MEAVSIRFFETALGLALVGVALWLRLWNLDAYTGSFDEGIRAQQLLLMAGGYRPFRDVFASQGPLLLDLLYPFYLLFGQTLASIRAGVVVCSLVALAGAWWVARQAAGRVAGLAALALLAISPSFLEGSRLALAEVPTIAPALLALGALLAYREHGGRWLLVLSACCCAIALLIKPMVLHVCVPLGLLLLLPIDRPGGPSRSWQWRRMLTDVAVYSAVVAGLCAATILLLGPAQVWDNLGAYRGGAGSAAGADAADNLRLTANIMRREQLGLFVLAGAGTLLGLWRRPSVTLALAAWACAVLALFAVYGDLADKHIVYLTPPVVLLAAVGVGLGVEAIRDLTIGRRGVLSPRLRGEPLTPRPPYHGAPSSPRPPLPHAGEGETARMDRCQKRVALFTNDDDLQPSSDDASGLPLSRVRERGAGGEGRLPGAAWLAALLGLLGIAAYLWSLPALYRADLYLLREAPRVAAERRGRTVDLEIAEIIRSQTPADGWVLADNPGAAYEARRRVIPYLVDTSGTRIDAGSLTADLAAEYVERYQPSVIVTWPLRLGKLDDFVRRLPSLGYRLDRTYEQGWKVYVRE